tara:strand:- start:114 stop:470 length:357 start_codon:yes stop_codon:yes gene_type:complete
VGVVCFCVGTIMEIAGASAVPFYARTDSVGGLNSGPLAVDRERLSRSQRVPVNAKAKGAAWEHYYALRMNRERGNVQTRSMIESVPTTEVAGSGARGLALFSLMGPRYNAGRLFNAYA